MVVEETEDNSDDQEERYKIINLDKKGDGKFFKKNAIELPNHNQDISNNDLNKKKKNLQQAF